MGKEKPIFLPDSPEYAGAWLWEPLVAVDLEPGMCPFPSHAQRFCPQIAQFYLAVFMHSSCIA